MIEIEDRHRELLRTLAGARVQFVLVGGVALQLRGFLAPAVADESQAVDREALDQQLERLRRLKARAVT